MKSINYVSLPYRESNKLRGGASKSGVAYFCDESHDEISETIFSRK